MTAKNIHKPFGLNIKPKFSFWTFLALALIAYIAVVYFLPMPKLTATAKDLAFAKSMSTTFSWPGQGQGAIGAVGYGVIGTKEEQSAKPIASIAKTFLAYAVLKEKPLAKGVQGPSVTINENDINFYKEALSQNGSVVPVELGEHLSEYQLLQALLIPSGGNIGDTLAVWAFGSIDKYLAYANKMATDMGLSKTHLADTSGLSAESVSSARDLVVFGEAIMQNPVLAEIVAQRDVTLPVVGKVNNYNTLLGQNNVIGIKTGNTDEAGGCLLFAAEKSISDKTITIIGAILNDTNRYQVLLNTNTFLKNNKSNFKIVKPVTKGQVVATYNTPWGKKIEIVAKTDLNILATSEKVDIKTTYAEISKQTAQDEEVGTISAEYGSTKVSVPAVLKEKISRPPLWWRLIHP